MRHNYQPRLKIYNKTLGKFDWIDKYNNLQLNLYNDISIKIFWHFNDQNKINLNNLLFKEFYFQQRFNYKKIFKRVENTFFIVTLRKKFVFLYLEMLLNSYFLKTNIKYKIDTNFIPITSIFTLTSCQNKFFNYFSSSQTKLTKIKNIFNFESSLNLEQVLLKFNYYFLPSYTI